MRTFEDEKYIDCDCDIQIRIGDSYIEYFDKQTSIWKRMYPAFWIYKTETDVITLKGGDGTILTIEAGCTVSIDGTEYADFNDIYDEMTTQIVNFFFDINGGGAYMAANGIEFIEDNKFGLGGGLTQNTLIEGNGFILNLGNGLPFSELIGDADVITLKGGTAIQIQTPNQDAGIAKIGDQLVLVDAQGTNEYAKNKFRGNLAASPINGANYTTEDGDYYYNTVANEFVYYDGSRSKWLSVNSYIAEYSAGVIAAGNPFIFEGNTFTTSSTAKIRGIYIDGDSVIVESLFRKSLAGAATATVLIYKNNDESMPIHTITSLVASPLAIKELLNIDVSDGDLIGVINAAGSATIETPKGYLVIKRKY